MRLLLIGPIPPPISGVSLANKIVLEYFPKYSSSSIDYINTNYEVLKEDIGRFSFKKAFFYVKMYREVGKIMKCDCVYMTVGQTFLGVVKYYPFFLAARLFKKEIVVHIHGNHVWREYDNLYGWRKRVFCKVLEMSSKGIVLSKSLKKNLTPFLPEDKIYILENFVEDFLFDSVKVKRFDKLRIIYLSNLMQEKGIIDLFEALLILDKRGVDFKAKIAGGMDDRISPLIQKYINRLPGRLDFLGLVYKEEKKKLLEWGNIFVFPTYYKMEGQPISIFEAMATGNIILTTAHAGIPDVFEERTNGFYIEKQSPQSIVDELIEIEADIKSYKHMSEHNKKEAKEKYRVESFIKKLYCILSD